MSDTAVRVRRWTRVEYERAIDRGIFGEDERLELLNGLLVVGEPQGNPHAVAVDLVLIALRHAFGDAWLIRAHAPMALGRHSRPEPDVAVISGTPRDYLRRAPGAAALVVEVSDSSLELDRGRKASIYARGRIPEYWILDLGARSLEVHRDPGASRGATRRRAYRSVEIVPATGSVSPLGAPAARIAVRDLLPDRG